MKKLIINADDFGLTKGVSKAIVELLEKGAISNTTVMICVPGAFELCGELQKAGLAGRAGVHLTTTLENGKGMPLSPAKEIPSIVDQLGNFRNRGAHGEANPDEVRVEWERQIQKVSEALGQNPTHLDSHHGIHRIPHLTPVYLELAKKYGIPVRGGREIGQIDGSVLGVISSDLCCSGWTGQNKSLKELQEALDLGFSDLGGSGLLELVSHPGLNDDDLIKASSWNSVRENDYKVLLELSQSNWLKNNGIELVRYPGL